MNIQQRLADNAAPLGTPGARLDRVMAVLRGIRAARSDGRVFDSDANLTDAGFTSMDMVKVMLGVEGAFDLMIPQEHITPENFRSGRTIAAMLAGLAPAK